MNSYRFNMWQSGRKILLREILRRLSIQRAIIWSLLDFYGTGMAPDGKGMVEFEGEVRRAPGGFLFDEDALKRFSDGLTDLYDLRLVGAEVGDESGRVVVEVSAVDSSWWEVKVDEACISFAGEDLRSESGRSASID